jgi:uncharacterized membrane-anchored protein
MNMGIIYKTSYNKTDKTKNKQSSGGRFMAMSKLIGIIIIIFLAVIIVYSMIEMHINHDLSSLTQLIISMFALAGVYVGFYLTMAKVEHVEQEISARQERLKECGVTNQELIDAYSQQNQQLNDILGQLITKDDSTL